ncbi:hypothetical protein CVD28_00800 [Bacillus sp. M6-12]|uniref:hypothetical protein n=1 Tax=Bacillus sp. M6-12 TaxID=2054166 RepID=UPI000C7840E7|nr:hypothetical protein [Bacillus sp. M6-12]PLS18972.1 hypothetical protein CVD28_00800 [Bacillus sp. M6-12]
MHWWIKEEINKYKNKKVKYNRSIWTVKEVFWNEKEEEFVYWIENSKGKLEKVFEKNIELITLQLKML